MRLGVIGTSWITAAFAKGAKEAGFALSTVYSRDQERGLKFARENGFQHTVSSLELLVSSTDVDVIYIASPNGVHCEQAELCVKNGKHVLVEKPCFASAAQLERILALAKEHNVYVLETIRPYYNPALKTLKDSLPLIGPVRYAYFQFMKYSSRYDAVLAGQCPAMFDSALAGGALGDLGIYNAYLAHCLFGVPAQTTSNAVLLPSGVDGVSTQVLTYDGFLCVIANSKISMSGLRSEIQGEKGTILINDTVSLSEISLFDGKGERVLAKTGYDDMTIQQRELLRILSERDDMAAETAVTFMRDTVSFVEACRNSAGIKYLPQ